ncbi:PTS system cellobiose-specific IIB component [Scopulibacillus darangshiensis]|uniref:PTS system cellobiose-specific IIB component n=1 Tax=Scopulibacillus darangshiensis TaxID=442528 RepID=A0A4R2P2B5_9BACL|nr:PTS sugar transporter subunit IIB [Scopulibacillus darangshiensis]TCP28853.1 PTS system cellobiose-specific IIB component [Scopulibacillus darangshiensis]
MKVLFVCAGGMSSAIVVNALKKEAEKQGVAMEAEAVGTPSVEDEIRNGWNLVLVAPQVRHRFDSVKAIADEAGIPCEAIAPRSYTPMAGPTLYQQVKEYIK